MPGGDKTGPLGMGPMTGRGAGYCRGFSVAGYANRGFGGRGMGRGIGFGGGGMGRGTGFGGGGYGRGRRNRFFATGIPGWAWNWGGSAESPASQQAVRGSERRYLEEEAEALRRELAAIDQRLAQLKNEKD